MLSQQTGTRPYNLDRPNRGCVCSSLPPGFIVPLMPTLVDEPPTTEGWIHEVKHDGYRTILAVYGASTRAFTPEGPAISS
jgi:ATP-dependent DNA ligase